jgi:hypothetical protein
MAYQSKKSTGFRAGDMAEAVSASVKAWVQTPVPTRIPPPKKEHMIELQEKTAWHHITPNFK